MKTGQTYNLRLEYILEKDDKEILQRYGIIKSGVTRDIAVPGTMSLHGLHYLIMRYFGFHCTPHFFALDKEKFLQITENKFLKWAQHCGQYFRFPVNEEDMEIDKDQFPRSKQWWAAKYSEPDLDIQQNSASDKMNTMLFIMENPTINIPASIEEWISEGEVYLKKKIDEVSCDDFESAVLFSLAGLKAIRECLTVAEIFTEEKSEWPHDTTFSITCDNLEDIMNIEDNADRIDHLFSFWEELISIKEIKPITKELLYNYRCDSYGGSSKVRISLINIDQERWISEPICISADGFPVWNKQTGGVENYCDYLEKLYGNTFIKRNTD